MYPCYRPRNLGKVRQDAICLWAFSKTTAQSMQKSCCLAPRPPHHPYTGKDRDSRDLTKMGTEGSKLSRSSLHLPAPSVLWGALCEKRDFQGGGGGGHGNQSNSSKQFATSPGHWVEKAIYLYKRAFKNILHIFSLFADNRAMSTDL